MNKSYAELYNHCQRLEPKISRKDIKQKISEIFEECPKQIKVEMDTTQCRGYFISANSPSPFSKFASSTGLIILAQGMNTCWDRFVYTKELMHLFDTDLERIDTGEKFKELLQTIIVGTGNKNGSTISEYTALWRALACLCPEEKRQDFIMSRSRSHIDDYGIALQLKIPQQYVPLLLRPDFKELLAL